MLDASTLESMIIAEMQAAGFVTTGEHAKSQLFAKAISKAVVQHIQSNAQVLVTGGSYKVK